MEFIKKLKVKRANGTFSDYLALAADADKVFFKDGETLETKMSKVDTAGVLDIFYPIGSYYETSDDKFNPNISWGGTWIKDTDGQVLVAQDDGEFKTLNSDVGADKKTISISNLPAHNHTFTGTESTHSHFTYNHSHHFSGTTDKTTISGTMNIKGNSESYATVVGATGSLSVSSGPWSGTHNNLEIRGSSANNNYDTVKLSNTHTHSFSGTTDEDGYSITSGESITPEGTIGNTGGGNAFNVIQNSKVCIRWHRTA